MVPSISRYGLTEPPAILFSTYVREVSAFFIRNATVRLSTPQELFIGAKQPWYNSFVAIWGWACETH